MIMDQQYGIGRPNATLLEKNKYCVNSLQHMATKCELDKRDILLFPKVIHGCSHAEYISVRSCNGLVLRQSTQVMDLCGQITPVSQPINSEASVMEALVACSNIMSYRTDVWYLVFYIMSFQKWNSNVSPNNFSNHYRQQPPPDANLHYHSGICVIDLEPLSRGQHPLTIYYEPHAFLQTPRVRTMVAGVVFWDHMTYNPHHLPPIKDLSIAEMLGADEIFVFLGHLTVYPICGQYLLGFIAMLLDGKFPDLCVTDYKVSHAEVIRKITSNGYKLQVITSRGTCGDAYALTPFEQTCYMPLILNFPVDLMVTCNIQGPAIKFAKATHQSFRPLHNLFYYLTSGHFYYNLGGMQYPACQSFP